MKALLLEEIKNVLQAEMRTALAKGLVNGVSIDSRTVKAGELFVALRGDRFDGHDFLDVAAERGAIGVVVDRSMPVSDVLKAKNVAVMKVKDTVAALGALARFYRRKLVGSVHVVGVTGSSGKTTVREMIYHVMSRYKKGSRSQKNYNNNIGVPLTIFGIESDHNFAVVEIGSSGPGEIAALSRIAEPDIAVITSVGPSHLAGLKDVEGVSVEKVSIVAGLKEHGVVVCGTGHKGTLDKVRALDSHVITFGLEKECEVHSVNLCQAEGGYQFETNDHCRVMVPMAGLHNVKNALAALAVVRRLGITSRQFADAIADFEPVAGRGVCRNVNGITIIDDSYNANPLSMQTALQGLVDAGCTGRRIFVCGDMAELGDDSSHYHQELGIAIARSKIDILFAVGEQASITARAALEAGMGHGQVQRSINSKRLGRLIKSMILDGDVILVKGSRVMELEKVVVSLGRWKGRGE